jgi:hypothetical protein
MAIEVGDAVLKFLGDSSQLDSKFDDVQPNAEKAFGGAAEAVEEGTGRMQTSLSEARGEAALLGEEIGVHLPRHVRTFIAELPGVGEALSAAFSATAILFVAQALVQLTEKATNFIANNLIYTQAMKDSNNATIETNKLLLEQSANYDKAKDSLEKFGATGTDDMRLKLEALKTQIATTQASVITGEQQNQQQRQITHEYISQTGWLSKAWDWGKAIVEGGKTQIDTIKGQTAAIQNRVLVDSATVKALKEQQELLEKQLETEHKLEAIRQGSETKSAGAKLKAAQAQAEVAEDSQTAEKRKAIAEQLENTLYTIKRDGMLKRLAILKEDDDNTKDAQAKLLSEMKVAADNQAAVVLERLVKAKDELQKTLQDMAKDVHDAPPIEPITPMAIQNLLKGISTAHDLGITLRQDLVAAYVAAKKAQDDFMASGIQDGVAQTAIANNLLKAKRALDEYGNAADKASHKLKGMFSNLKSDAKSGDQAMQQVGKGIGDAFNQIQNAAAQALTSIILAQGGAAKALEKAVEQTLASLASQAVIFAIKDIASAYEASAHYDYESASQYTAAAEQWGVVAALAGGAAAGLARAGGGGGSSNTQQGHNSANNAGQQNRSGGSAVSIQQFATGGLISAPTLAIMGEESKREAVLPLDDPRTTDLLRQKIGGGGGVTVHVAGHVIGANDVVHLVKQINKAVNRGQAHLISSNSLRLTKRSA